MAWEASASPMVSRRTGIAKTTIYRHRPTRSALVLDAFVAFVVSPALRPSG